jgi:hypothetical protein
MKAVAAFNGLGSGIRKGIASIRSIRICAPGI